MKAYVDVETRKVPVPPGLVSRGRPVTKRWQVFLVGVALTDGPVEFLDGGGDEAALMADLAEWCTLRGVTELVYAAGLRSFDEKVLRGVFVNARREFLTEPGPWPRLELADEVEWRNLGALPDLNPDGLGKAAPEIWAYDPDAVRSHCGWDVEELRRYDLSPRSSL